MNRKLFLVWSALLLTYVNVNSQMILFSDDEREWGYHDKNYQRYEAEPGKCESDGRFLLQTYDQRNVQSEASNQVALELLEHKSYVQWTNEFESEGLTIRFSLPDDAEGNGTSGDLILFINEDSIQKISLNSYWAWQYILKSGSKYPDNTPNSNTKFPRMRFDEMHVNLNVSIPANSTFRLEKADDNDLPYVIDFVELEKVEKPLTYEEITDENKVIYTNDDGALQVFISQNQGKTIYIPPGKYDIDGRIIINGDGTKIIGAGIWHTELFFTASSDEKSTYNRRGIESYGSNIVLEGMYINTINNKRYYDNNPIYQVGKGLMGSFGSNSIIKNLWIEHFECGGWIEGAQSLTIQHCRFRNNYADGMNLAYGCKNSVVENSSFRNNGDDDMASWSRADRLCENNIYRYCTSENNWRASGLGFFGGKQNKAYNNVIIDPMEAGLRVTCDFPGLPFSTDGYSEFYNIAVYNGGVKSGPVGIYGDLWGNQQGALHLNSSSQYDLQNFKIINIELHNSKENAIFLGSISKQIKNLILRDIIVDGAARYGIYYYNTKGDGSYCNLSFQNISTGINNNSKPASFLFEENCNPVNIAEEYSSDLQLVSYSGLIKISGEKNSLVSVFDILGRKCFEATMEGNSITVSNLKSGIYVVRYDQKESKKVFVY